MNRRARRHFRRHGINWLERAASCAFAADVIFLKAAREKRGLTDRERLEQFGLIDATIRYKLYRRLGI